MKNIDLNAGGLIGALACGGIAAAIVFSTMEMGNNGRRPSKLVISALIGGAFVGNYIWGIVFKKPEMKTGQEEGDETH